MKEIILSKGEIAFVDDEDFEVVNSYKWEASKHGRTYRATRSHRHTYNGEWHSMNATMHRFILKAEKGKIIDHIDGNGLNNQRLNLRFCTQAENCRNAPSRMGTSRFLGVSWDKSKGKWVSQVHIRDKYVKIGTYESEIEAALAYNCSASFSYREFARLNKI